MESNEQRQAREELIGRCLDMVNQAAELQKTAAEVIAGLMAMNPPPGFVGGHYPNGPIQLVPEEAPIGRHDPTLTGSEEPAPPLPSAKSRLLDAYAKCDTHSRKLAIEIGVNPDSADTYLSQARTDNDPRVDEGDKLRGKGKYGKPRQPAQRGPRSPLTMWSGMRNQDCELPQGKVMVCNEAWHSITGPLGSITLPKATFKAISILADEQAHELRRMQEAGRYKAIDLLRDDIALAASRLEELGIDIVYVGKHMCKIRAAKEENSEQ